jgi:hypothetical protein
MALLCIETEQHDKAMVFYRLIKKNLADGNYIKNPFMGQIRAYVFDDSYIFVLSMTPIYFNFPLILLITGATTLVLFGWQWYTITQLAIGGLSVAWTPAFIYFFFLLGLKKAGYKGDVKLLSKKDTLVKVCMEKK